MANGSGSILGFEEHLWSVADKLRGTMDASEYKHVVLGLIFLKYINDTFIEFFKKLQNKGHMPVVMEGFYAFCTTSQAA